MKRLTSLIDIKYTLLTQPKLYELRALVVAQLVEKSASDTRDPRFESRHWHNFINQLYNRKDKNKEKEAGNGPSLKNLWVNDIVD